VMQRTPSREMQRAPSRESFSQSDAFSRRPSSAASIWRTPSTFGGRLPSSLNIPGGNARPRFVHMFKCCKT
jgi:hypothetical protein